MCAFRTARSRVEWVQGSTAVAARALLFLGLSSGPAVLGGVTGCSTESPEGPVGTVVLNLTTEKDGTTYRLRNAVFSVEGPESISLTTEDDPNADVLSVELEPGQYTLTLLSGWNLERFDGSEYAAIEAELLGDNPRLISIQPSALLRETFRFLASSDEPEPSVNLFDLLGFENQDLWSSSATLSTSSTRVQGLGSLAVVGGNFNFVSSVPLSNLPVVDERVAVFLRLPTTQPNPNWYGELVLTLDAPSIGLDEARVGTVPLTGLPTGEWFDVEFTLSQPMMAALGETYSDLVIRLGLNIPHDATGTYRFDNLRFGGVSACDSGCDDGTCVDGICVIECPELYGNCDGNQENACETPLSADSSNCGGCGIQCGPGAVCQSGECVVSAECGANEADCDGNAVNGCEVDTSADPDHCGGCGIECEGAEGCVAGACLAGDLNAVVQVTGDWGSGYCANLHLTNVGSATTTSWSVVIDPVGGTFSPWSANVAQSGGLFTLTPLGWNAQIAPGATNVSVGFCSNRSSGSAVATVVSVTP